MQRILTDKITGLSSWHGAQLQNDSSWIYPLTQEVITDIDEGLAGLKSRNLTYPDFCSDDFPLNQASPLLKQCSVEMEDGRGFVVLRGLPAHRYTEDELQAIYYAAGLQLGTPVCQNPNGDLIGRVMNVGDLTKKDTRVYETNAYLPYHTDLSDVFGLLCIRKAKSGGLTSLVSSAAVYNEFLENYPQYIGLFYRPLYYAHLGDGINKSPVFSYHKGKLACRYLRQYIELEHEQQQQPLSSVETEALDIFDQITHSPEVRLDMMLEPGDMLFANNYTVMHSRTSFEDYPEPEQRRKLLRLWIKMPNARELAPDFPGQNGFPPPQSR